MQNKPAVTEIMKALQFVDVLEAKDAIVQHLHQALEHLGYTPPSEPENGYTDGRYIFHEDGYKKEVTAVFDADGNLQSLLDDEGNQWREYVLTSGVFSSTRVDCYLEAIT